MKYPRKEVRRVPDPEYVTGYCWQIICLGEVADQYCTRAEAREFARGYDPEGWYCLTCDNSRHLPDAAVRPGQWQCRCGAWNDEPKPEKTAKK